MIVIQVVPRAGTNAYQLLRSKVLHEAATWDFANKAKTRLRHIQSAGHIEVSNAGGVISAQVHPKDKRDHFYLAEKFMGRLVAWFEDDLVAINVQFVDADKGKRRTVGKKKKRAAKKKPARKRAKKKRASKRRTSNKRVSKKKRVVKRKRTVRKKKTVKKKRASKKRR